MLVFADALETDVPDANDPDVLFFGPGVHEIGDTKMDTYKTVYLAGGAYVKGRLQAGNMQDFTIRGRGVLSGEAYPHGTNNDHHLLNIGGGQTNGVLIEGITLVNSPLYLILLKGSHNTIRNVKMMGWYFGTDGTYAGRDSLIEDCFLKVNDDALKPYESNSVIRDCVIWQLENGAVFQISWNMPSNNSGFHIQNIDIIRMEHEWNNINLAAFDAVHGGSGHMKDYLFEDIRIENADWRLFYITLQKHEFAPADAEMGQISDLTFRNITATGELKKKNVIKGWNADHKVFNITFENLKINEKYIHNAEEGNFEIDPETTHNIVFKVDEDLDANLAAEEIAQVIDTTAQCKAGDVRIFDGIEFVWIPPGKFSMGSPSSESERDSDEGPMREVVIEKGFWMGKTEVTQAQWDKVMEDNPSEFKGGDLPAERVNWVDATEFCRVLSEKTGQSYALPTEAQWEYACRAGSTTAYSFGDDPAFLQDYGWCESNSGEQTHPVAQKLPNPWGLYDMHGNVWEWCQDLYSKDYNPTKDGKPSQDVFKVLRGGSWSYGARLCRSANRDHDAPLARAAFDGCRLVRTP
jgi:formylglycine-generating enzyme required for sulfatase activity